jgi:hypothetical protein
MIRFSQAERHVREAEASSAASSSSLIKWFRHEHAAPRPKDDAMNQLDHIIIELLDVIETGVRLILAGLAAIEIWVRTQLVHLGVPPGISVVILLAVALLLIVGALRLFGSIAYVVVTVFIVLLVLHALMPVVLQH